MKIKLATIVLGSIVFLSGCSKMQYNQDEIRIMKSNSFGIKGNIKINEFEYLPPKGLSQREISSSGNLPSAFTNMGIDINTRVSEIVKAELERAKNEYLITSNKNPRCQLNGVVYYLGWSSWDGDTESIISYSLEKDGITKYKKKLEYTWNRSFVDFKTSLFQSISSSIHGNFFELTDNAKFRKIISEECK